MGNLQRLFRNRAIYNSIKNNSELRAKSVRFGVFSVVNSVFAVLLSILVPIGIKMLDAGFFGILFGVLLLAAGALGALMLITAAIMNFSFQLSLNKRAVGWVALVVLCLAIAGCAVIIILFMK